MRTYRLCLCVCVIYFFLLSCYREGGEDARTDRSQNTFREDLSDRTLTFPLTLSGDRSSQSLQMTVTLMADGIFRMKIRSQLKDPGAHSVSFTLGWWKIDPERHEFILSGDFTELRRFILSGKGFIVSLRNGQLGRSVDASDTLTLVDYDPLAGPMPIQGNFVYYADAAIFMECYTQKSYPVLMSQDYPALERAYLESIPKPGSIALVSLHGRFTNSGAREKLIVEYFNEIWPEQKCDATKSAIELQHTGWQLTVLENRLVVLPEGFQTPYLRFLDKNHLTGTGGCHSLDGNYQQSGRRLSISSLLGSTEVDCPPEVEKIEQQFINALELTRSYTLEGDRLHLRDKSGKLLAYFQAAQIN